MGCCVSSPAGANSPYPGGAGPSSSARAINTQPQPVRAPTAQAGADDSPPAPSRRRRHRQPLDQHINKPLRRHEWTSRNRIWTPLTLERERRDFFDTRVTGREEVWQTLRAALELLWESDSASRSRSAAAPETDQEDQGEDVGPDEESRAAALATAQTILTAADITLPTGDLAQGAYDLTGNYYPLPEYIVSDPVNISLVQHQSGSFRDAKADFTAGEESVDDEDFESDEEAERRREEKGKSVLNTRDQIQVKARLSEGARDIVISVGRCERVRSVARRLMEEAGLPAGKKIRIAYMGKILKEKSSLTTQGWKPGHIINALVFNR